LSDPVPTPTDPLLETLAIPTPPQIVPQPHITESTTNETTVNYPNQEQTTTRTHGFKHHSLPTIEIPHRKQHTRRTVFNHRPHLSSYMQKRQMDGRERREAEEELEVQEEKIN
jgi:hypothetical protein